MKQLTLSEKIEIRKRFIKIERKLAEKMKQQQLELDRPFEVLKNDLQVNSLGEENEALKAKLAEMELKLSEEIKQREQLELSVQELKRNFSTK